LGSLKGDFEMNLEYSELVVRKIKKKKTKDIPKYKTLCNNNNIRSSCYGMTLTT
jgi:hypothetical protein